MNSRAWMMGLLVIMAVICSSALSFVNIKTAPIIRKNEEIKYMSTVLDVFGITFDRDNSDEILAIFGERIEEREEQGLSLFFEKVSGATSVSFSGNGFQGPISLVVALDGETITGFKVVSQEETPGLGGEIGSDWFRERFRGKSIEDAEGVRGFIIGAGAGALPNGVDAITGATMTCEKVEEMLNAAIARIASVGALTEEVR